MMCLKSYSLVLCLCEEVGTHPIMTSCVYKWTLKRGNME